MDRTPLLIMLALGLVIMTLLILLAGPATYPPDDKECVRFGPLPLGRVILIECKEYKDRGGE